MFTYRKGFISLTIYFMFSFYFILFLSFSLIIGIVTCYRRENIIGIDETTASFFFSSFFLILETITFTLLAIMITVF